MRFMTSSGSSFSDIWVKPVISENKIVTFFLSPFICFLLGRYLLSTDGVLDGCSSKIISSSWDEAASLVPHSSQNFAPVPTLCPQSVHAIVRSTPHSLQDLTPIGLPKSHLGHFRSRHLFYRQNSSSVIALRIIYHSVERNGIPYGNNQPIPCWVYWFSEQVFLSLFVGYPFVLNLR